MRHLCYDMDSAVTLAYLRSSARTPPASYASRFCASLSTANASFTCQRRHHVAGEAIEVLAVIEVLSTAHAPFTLAKSFMLEEREIILREYEANVVENPYFEIEQNITKALYPSSPWAR